MSDDGYSCYDTSFGLVAVKAYPGEYTWEDAVKKCSEDGTNGVNGELPAPRSSVENHWFVDKANELGLSQFWLGVNDKDQEGEWRNHRGFTQRFFNWAPNEPNNKGKNSTVAHCGKAGGEYGKTWDDDSCKLVKKHLMCTYVATGGQFNRNFLSFYFLPLAFSALT